MFPPVSRTVTGATLTPPCRCCGWLDTPIAMGQPARRRPRRVQVARGLPADAVPRGHFVLRSLHRHGPRPDRRRGDAAGTPGGQTALLLANPPIRQSAGAPPRSTWGHEQVLTVGTGRPEVWRISSRAQRARTNRPRVLASLRSCICEGHELVGISGARLAFRRQECRWIFRPQRTLRTWPAHAVSVATWPTTQGRSMALSRGARSSRALPRRPRSR